MSSPPQGTTGGGGASPLTPMKSRSFGTSMRRKEDARLLTGRGKYAADFRMPGMLQAAILRSPHPHARLVAIRADTALALPGVVAAVTAADLGPIGRIPTRLGHRIGNAACLQPPLALDKVRYVGEPVAAVIAESRYVAEDALELMEVDYEPLATVADARRAVERDAPVLHEAVGDNVADRLETHRGDAARAMAGAGHRVRERFAVQRHTGVPMETRGLTAAYDAGTGVLRLWGVAKVPHFNRRVLADLLGHPEHRIHFVEMEVGGGFGVRGEFYPEDLVVPWAAMRLGRPVQWIEDRREHLMATNHSRQQHHDVEIGFDGEGRIVALVDRFLVDLGAYVRTHGVVVPELTAALMPGPYRIPNYSSVADCVLTNKTPTGTYRGPGRYEGTFVRERLLDVAAERLGIDRLELRRRNFITSAEMPYEIGGAPLAHKNALDCGDYRWALDQALELCGYDRARAVRDAISASASAACSRRPGSARGNTRGSRSTRPATSSSTPASPRWARASRRPWPRSAPTSSACPPRRSPSCTATASGCRSGSAASRAAGVRWRCRRRSGRPRLC